MVSNLDASRVGSSHGHGEVNIRGYFTLVDGLLLQ